jgi:DNA helicase-2/ATP-dependent DNA helicase PcrA
MSKELGRFKMKRRTEICSKCGNEVIFENGKNPQLEALVKINKPILVQAGPGTGKTYAMAYKVKHLIRDEKVPKEAITVITFTNEAAINMRKRLSTDGDENSPYVEPEKQPAAIWTMHSLCNKLLRSHAIELGMKPDVKTIHSQTLIKALIQDAAQLVEGGTRDEGLKTLECRKHGECSSDSSLKCIICSRYREILKAINCIDHDDQILLACQLLKKNERILRDIQKSAKYLLVDEYQDINHAQWELIQILSRDQTNNLLVVGDEYQSIYGFRGGHPKFIKNFKTHYGPEAQEMPLLISWRCPENVIRGAFSMVHKYCGGDLGILDKLEYKNKVVTKIKIKEFENENLEAWQIARQIKSIGPSHDVLILIPTLDYAGPIKQQLTKSHIGYCCECDMEDTDIYFVNTILTWLKEPTEDLILRNLVERIFMRRLAGISAKNREEAYLQISKYWTELRDRWTLYSKIKSLEHPKLQKIKGLITELRRSYENDDANTFIATMISKLQLWQVTSQFTKEIQSVCEEIENFVPSGEKNVRIMTMKKAKGLEADDVYIVGVEENIIPRASACDEHKAEDSRQLYVSMTRAKKELYIFNSRSRRRSHTKSTYKKFRRSEFIHAIPREYVEDMDS